MNNYDNPRHTFLLLDIRAKRFGGIKNLLEPEQIEYIRCGHETGFLPRRDADMLMRELKLKIDLSNPVAQKK